MVFMPKFPTKRGSRKPPSERGRSKTSGKGGNSGAPGAPDMERR